MESVEPAAVAPPFFAFDEPAADSRFVEPFSPSALGMSSWYWTPAASVA